MDTVVYNLPNQNRLFDIFTLYSDVVVPLSLHTLSLSLSPYCLSQLLLLLVPHVTLLSILSLLALSVYLVLEAFSPLLAFSFSSLSLLPCLW